MLKRIWIPSPNYSSRGGSNVRLLVIHTAEGSKTIESLGSWFQNPSSGVSSHAGADDKVNTIGEYVHRQDKSWTQAEFNPVAVSIELCGFSAWLPAEWNNHPNMLSNCAQWIAEEAAHYGIPITRLSASEAQGSGRGVAQHKDLGSRGGNHSDCGPSFPMDRVLAMARGEYPQPPELSEDTMSIAATKTSDDRMALFVHLESGEVKQLEQERPGGDWWKKEDGGYNWISKGHPGK